MAEIGIANPGEKTDSSTEEMETTGHPYTNSVPTSSHTKAKPSRLNLCVWKTKLQNYQNWK